MADAPAVWSSCRLLEFDFAGIEQVLMGWCMRDPAYIRTAKLGTHAIVASHVLAAERGSRWQPADLAWPDGQLAAYLKTVKKATDEHVQTIYDRSKRTVHGTAYGLTPFGMCRNFPQTFPTIKSAEAIQRVYFSLAPGVPRFQADVRHTAHLQHFLGGADPYAYHPDEADPARPRVVGHPFAYQHWFWSVVAYTRLNPGQHLWRAKRGMPLMDIAGIWYGVVLGEDAKRAVAFYPQSIARGVLTESCWPLFEPDSPDYIGDVYYGQTPLRAPIHDSLLLEVPTRTVGLVVERVARAMGAPVEALPCPAAWGLGEALAIGVDGKIGEDWGAMEPVTLPGADDHGVATDVPYTPAEDGDEEDVVELETRLGRVG